MGDFGGDQFFGMAPSKLVFLTRKPIYTIGKRFRNGIFLYRDARNFGILLLRCCAGWARLEFFRPWDRSGRRPGIPIFGNRNNPRIAFGGLNYTLVIQRGKNNPLSENIERHAIRWIARCGTNCVSLFLSRILNPGTCRRGRFCMSPVGRKLYAIR